MTQYIEGGPITPVLSLTEAEWLERNQQVQGGPVHPVYVVNQSATGGIGLPDLSSFYSTYSRPATGLTALDQGGLAATPWFQPSANYLYYVPFFRFQNETTLTDIDFELLGISGGGTINIRVGLYTTNSGLIPGAKVADYGVISTAVTGVKSIVANTAITDDIYLLAFVADKQCDLSVSVGGLFRGINPSDSGYPEFSIQFFRVAFAYAALPTNGPAWVLGVTDSDSYGFNCPFFVRTS